MMGRRSKIALLLYLVFLTVLFLMCSTDLIIREPEKEVYQIAVIIEDVRDDNYGNFRKGMDQAAVELNADVRFITLYEKLDGEQQMELILREQQDGADALIVAPADEEQVAMALIQKQVTVPVVLLGSGLTGEGITGTVGADYRSMGEQLGCRLAEDVPEHTTVWLLSDPARQSVMSRLFSEGAVGVLEDRGFKCQTVTRDEEEGFGGFLKELERLPKDSPVLLAESPEILTEAAGIVEDSYVLQDKIWGLYGRGSSLSILNYLDRGTVTGICVADEFSEGYFSVLMAAQAVESSGIQKTLTMDSYYIEKEELRNPVYEKMLYPIE